MRRIGLAAVLALGLLAPLAADAQQAGRIPLVGVLRPTSPTDPLADPFRRGLRDLGYLEGHNIRLVYRFAEGRYERLPGLAAELVRLLVDVLVTDGPGAIVAKHATDTIPIVFVISAHPVEDGLVASLARPGGNITGFSTLDLDLAGKRVELLREIIPSLRRMAIVWNPGRLGHAVQVKELQAVTSKGGIQLEIAEVRNPQELDRAFRTLVAKKVGAVTVFDDAMFFQERTRITALAAQSQMPAMYGYRGYVEAGGLRSYGANRAELSRRAAIFVDKILKGVKPADLPIEQPTKFELVINLKTAKALGLTIPQSILVRADEIIH